MFLDSNFNDLLDAGEPSMLTDEMGEYRFADLPPGTYRVREAQPGFWSQTTPDPDVVLGPGENVSGVDFGNFHNITISGFLFEDTNGNGRRDEGESGMPGGQIFLDDNDNGLLDAGEGWNPTDSNGFWFFYDVRPGSYRFRQVQRPGWLQTTPNPPVIVPQSGIDVADVDFGNFQLITNSGMKFADLDADGQRDQGEPGLSSWTIQLDVGADGTVDRSTTTDLSGVYTFSGLGPGVYRVREVLQPGWVQTTADPEDIVAQSGGDVWGLDFGNFQTASISGRKFDDRNGNGFKDPDDPGLEGWTIFLDHNENGTQDEGEASTMTAADGAYSFAGLSASTYVVREVPQAGWVPTTSDFQVTLTSGAEVASLDFGNFQLITIGGVKFEDLDADGDRDPDEPGLEGWTIFLDKGADGTIDDMATTSFDGAYSFSGLGPGLYRVREEQQEGWLQTTPDPEDVVATSGGNVVDVDFGNARANQPPIAVDDTYETCRNRTLTVDVTSGVLANDDDADGDPLIVTLIASPSSGSLSLNPDGSFSYDPARGFTGEVSFTYQASDGKAQSNEATVKILVDPAGCPPGERPVANKDLYFLEDITLPLTVPADAGVLANDSFEGLVGTPTVSLIRDVQHGELTLNEDGSFTYEAAADFEFAGEDSFAYQFTIGGLVSNVAAVAIRQPGLLISKVEWIAHRDSRLDANPNAGGGLRIFPDKRSAFDQLARNKVNVRVTLNRPVQARVFLQLVDVDDPSSNTAPVDDEQQDDDNRQRVRDLQSRRTDADGIVTFTFDVSYQPGDNYRAVASIAEFPRIHVPQNDGELARVLDRPGGNPIPTADALTVAAPELLTVWRTLRVEVGAMGPVAGNTIRGQIINVVAAAGGQSVVTTDQTLDAAEANRFENGRLTDMAGNVFHVIQFVRGGPNANSTGPNFTVTVLNRAGGVQPARGAFSLVDDDLLKDGDPVPKPDTSTLATAMAEAYVRVIIGSSPNTPAFEANVPTVARERQIIDDNWKTRALNSSTFWVAYVLGAFQGPVDRDRDPDREGVTGPGTLFGRTPAPTVFRSGGGSLIYLESIRDATPAHPSRPPSVAVLEQDTIVHEIGHAVGGSSKHPVTGSDAFELGLGIGQTSPDGILVAHLDPSRYQPVYIDLIRSASQPWS